MKGAIYPYRNGFMVRFGRDISKWFKSRDQAERFLTGLRYEVDKGTFDLRDYASNKPLAFDTLAEKYINHKRKVIKPRSCNNIKNYMHRAISAWGDTNIKSINYSQLEDFLFLKDNISEKTRSNMRSCLHDFFSWLRKRRVITLAQVPEFPEVSYELGWRNIIEIDTQQAIIAEIRRISWDINPKVYIGIRWLSIYISVRPGELIGIKEKHINRDGIVVVPHSKDKKPKIIYLLDTDIKLINSIPRGLPDLHFFRHSTGKGGVKKGAKFGPRYLYKWWKKACDNLGIAAVDLYGGTRHTTASALASVMGPDEIKIHGTQHATNKAFERYFQRKASDSRKVSQAASDLQHSYKKTGDKKKPKVLKFKG